MIKVVSDVVKANGFDADIMVVEHISDDGSYAQSAVMIKKETDANAAEKMYERLCENNMNQRQWIG